MIPTHVLKDLTPDERVAFLSRNLETHFHVHPVPDTSEVIRTFAEPGGDVLTTTCGRSVAPEMGRLAVACYGCTRRLARPPNCGR